MAGERARSPAFPGTPPRWRARVAPSLCAASRPGCRPTIEKTAAAAHDRMTPHRPNGVAGCDHGHDAAWTRTAERNDEGVVVRSTGSRRVAAAASRPADAIPWGRHDGSPPGSPTAGYRPGGSTSNAIDAVGSEHLHGGELDGAIATRGRRDPHARPGERPHDRRRRRDHRGPNAGATPDSRTVSQTPIDRIERCARCEPRAHDLRHYRASRCTGSCCFAR